MADIHNKILDKYGIDVNEFNPLKLYKITDPGISKEELEKKIATTRGNWVKTVENGTNAKFVERDRKYLEKADSFEAILRDKKMLYELFDYFKKGEGASESENFAKEYFKIVATTKKIKKQDIDFFFEYFPDERKNKKSILEMLSKEFKVLGIKTDKEDKEEETEEEGNKKGDGPLIVNLFEKPTILKIRKAISFYELSLQSDAIKNKYPGINAGMYDFLELKDETDLKTFSSYLTKKREQAFAQRQEFEGFTNLVDFYNTMSDVVQYRDIVDNFTEFKLLIKYPKLTPYMYEFDEMKQETLKGIVSIASREYGFRDTTDFILTYFDIVSDNFNIQNQGIKGIIRKAHRSAGRNKLHNLIDEKLGLRNRARTPFIVNLIYILTYWPIFVFYLLFETIKVIASEIWKASFVAGAFMLVAANYLLPGMFGVKSIPSLLRLMTNHQWRDFLKYCFEGGAHSNIEMLILSTIVILAYLMIYLIPTAFGFELVRSFGKKIAKKFDWIGLERTFRAIFTEMKDRMVEQHKQYKTKGFVIKNLPGIIINIICGAIIIVLLVVVAKFIPKALLWLKS